MTDRIAGAAAAARVIPPPQPERVQSTKSGLRYLCADHGVYHLPPRRFARFAEGSWTWSTTEAGPYVSDHSKCQQLEVPR